MLFLVATLCFCGTRKLSMQGLNSTLCTRKGVSAKTIARLFIAGRCQLPLHLLFAFLKSLSVYIGVLFLGLYPATKIGRACAKPRVQAR